jgi:hypothetical protein
LFLALVDSLPPAVAGPVLALVSLVAQVEANPSSAELPGGELFQKVLNWTMQIALWGSLASLLIGAAVWGISQHAGNGYQAGRAHYRRRGRGSAAGRVVAHHRQHAVRRLTRCGVVPAPVL